MVGIYWRSLWLHIKTLTWSSLRKWESVFWKKLRYVTEPRNLCRTRKKSGIQASFSLSFPFCLPPPPLHYCLSGEMQAQQQLSCFQHWQWFLQSLIRISILFWLEEILTCLPEAEMKVKFLGKEINVRIIIIKVSQTLELASKASKCWGSAHSTRGNSWPCITCCKERWVPITEAERKIWLVDPSLTFVWSKGKCKSPDSTCHNMNNHELRSHW